MHKVVGGKRDLLRGAGRNQNRVQAKVELTRGAIQVQSRKSTGKKSNKHIQKTRIKLKTRGGANQQNWEKQRTNGNNKINE